MTEPAVPAHSLERLADLRPAPYNPRAIKAAAADGLGYSLTEFGDLSGITWNSRSGVLVCGHQRVDQLRKAGAVFLPGPPARFVIEQKGEQLSFAIRVVDWPLEKEKAANIAANNPKIMGEFTSAIDALLKDVHGTMPDDMFLGLQFDALALDLDLGRKPRVEDNPTPKPRRTTVIRPGDLWVLGSHRLLCGDSTNPEDVEVIVRRWENFTGRVAKLVTGETLDELAVARATPAASGDAPPA